MTLCATASRRPATSSSGAMPAARSSSPWLTRGPATAARRSTACAGGLSASTRSMSASARLAGRRSPAGGGRQLLGEERVALGAGEELVDQARLGPAAEDPRQLGDHLLAREALERHALDDRGALGLGHQRAQRMAAVQLVGAVGGEEQHALLARVAHEEGQEVARGAVGPVDVLEDEHERLRLGQPTQQRRAAARRRAPARARARRRGRARRAGGAAAPGPPRCRPARRRPGPAAR